MKVQKQKKIKYLTIAISLVVLLAIAAVSAYALTRPDSEKPADNSPTPSSIDEKKDFIENTDDNGQPLDKPSTDPSKLISFELSETESEVIITTKLVGIAEGTCTITVGEFSESARILYQPEFSTCEGFALKKTDIDASRQFSLKISTEDEDIIKTGYLGE